MKTAPHEPAENAIDRLRDRYSAFKLFRDDAKKLHKERNLGQGSEAAVEEWILKCFEGLKPAEREGYEELSQLVVDRGLESGHDFQRDDPLDVDFVEKCKKI